MQTITLTQGKVALVDDEDFEVLSAIKWCANRIGRAWYAVKCARLPDGSWATKYMHRLVLERKTNRSIVKGIDTDHINGDGLDNRRENLREVARGQNNRNCRKHSQVPTSRYLGVSRKKDRGRWIARVKVNGKDVFLGNHVTEIEAACAREAYIKAHPELMAKSNF